MLARLKGALVVAPTETATPSSSRPFDELEHEHRYANDKERLIGLIAAPIGAAIAFLITSDLIAHDPSRLLSDGSPNPHHVNVSLYHEVLIALLALSVLMMVTAWFRKRLYLGMTLALYGLTVFNLHYWGFGVPYVLFGAWMLVTSYRLHKSLKEASAEGGAAPGSTAGGGARPAPKPRASRRYTPKGS